MVERKEAILKEVMGARNEVEKESCMKYVGSCLVGQSWKRWIDTTKN